jgi:hypothetical protein
MRRMLLQDISNDPHASQMAYCKSEKKFGVF